MARVKAGRYPGIKKSCDVQERNVIVRVPGMISVVSRDWCAVHECWINECAVCGRAFHTVRTHTLYCSTACSQYAYRQAKKQVEVRK